MPDQSLGGRQGRGRGLLSLLERASSTPPSFLSAVTPRCTEGNRGHGAAAGAGTLGASRRCGGAENASCRFR